MADPPSPDEPAPLSPTRGLNATRRTALPTELISEIIHHASSLLVEEERHLASQAPLTNHFLLSAAIVSRTWHSIASTELLKNGLVMPKRTEGFLVRAEACGVKETLRRVRFGCGVAGAGGVRTDLEGLDDDAELDLLESSLPELASLELVGLGLVVGTRPSPGFGLKRVFFSNWDFLDASVAVRFESSLLTSLEVLESQPLRASLGPVDGILSGAQRRLKPILMTIPHIFITSNQFAASFYITILVTLGWIGPSETPAALESCHFECTHPAFRSHYMPRLGSLVDGIPHDLAFPNLTSLAAPLEVLHLLATRGPRPKLATLEVLAYSAEQGPPGVNEVLTYAENSEAGILELVKLPALETLKVPACWTSVKVDEACAAKGVVLRWT